jgi:GNAT superfamily N-acetyltransferase
MSFVISPLVLSEPSHVSALLALLEYYALDPMGGDRALSSYVRDNLVAQLRSRHDYFGWLAWHGDEAIGLVNCFEGFSTFAARPLLNVHDIVVVEAHRGKGVARALLAEVERCAIARACCKLTLEVLQGNEIAMARYRAFGFEPYELDPAAGQAVLMQKQLPNRLK